MGRQKLGVKRIEDRNSRQVTFSKRKSGLLKKAMELSVLCGVEIAVIFFSERGKLFEFCSKGSTKETIERYLAYNKEDLSSIKIIDDPEDQLLAQEDGHSTITTIKKHPEGCNALNSFDNLMQVLQRHFEEDRLKLLNTAEFSKLEKQVESLLRQTRSRKTSLMLETVSKLRQKEKEVEEANKQLRKEMTEILKEKNQANFEKQLNVNNGVVSPASPEPQGMLHFL